MALRGSVQKIISDPRTQLGGATKEIADWEDGRDQEELIRFGADKSLEWVFVMANSQHQNGVTETLIKQVKGVQKSLV